MVQKAPPRNIVVVDDHPAVVEGIKFMLQKNHRLCISQTFYNGSELLKNLNYEDTDILIIDINIPGTNGLNCLQAISRKKHNFKKIVYSTSDLDAVISTAISKNVDAYVLKDDPASELLAAVESVISGNEYYSIGIRDQIVQFKRQVNTKDNAKILSDREEEILTKLASGLSSGEIADKLNISPFTVNTHKKNMMLKLNLSNAAELIRYANQTRRF